MIKSGALKSEIVKKKPGEIAAVSQKFQINFFLSPLSKVQRETLKKV